MAQLTSVNLRMGKRMAKALAPTQTEIDLSASGIIIDHSRVSCLCAKERDYLENGKTNGLTAKGQ